MRLVDAERAQSIGWSVTNNGTPVKSLDVSAATLAQLRVVVGTLIDALKNAGVLTQ
jgi:hypothetical protein